jgi:arginine exporter protein ArgO
VTNPPPGYPSAPPPQEPPPQWAYPPVQYQPPYPSGPRPHEGLAVAALVLGILAACSVGWFMPGAILAIIFGAIAWRNGAKAKWGFWLGVVSLVAFVVWIIAIAATTNNTQNSLSRSYPERQPAVMSRA